MIDVVLFPDPKTGQQHAWRVCGGQEREPVVLAAEWVLPNQRCDRCWPWLERALGWK